METQKIGFFEEAPGVKSSSRLNATIIIWGALLLAIVVVVVTLFTEPKQIIAAAGSACALFISMATPAMIFQFKQKQTEELNKA